MAQWDVSTGKEQTEARLKHGMAISSAALSKRNNVLVTHCSLGEQGTLLQSWDLQNGKLLHRRELKGIAISHITFEHGSNPNLLVTGVLSENGRPTLISWDCKQDQLNQHKAKHLLGAGIVAVLPSLDNEHLLTVGGRGARLWNIKSEKETMSFRPAGAVRSIAISQNGLTIAAGAADGSIKLWDTQSMKVVRKILQAHQGPVHSVVLSGDASRLVSAGEDGRVMIWNPNTSQEGDLLGKSDQPVHCVTMSRDGRLLFSSSDGSTGTLWNLETKTVMHRLEGHQESITAAAFSDDLQWLVTGSSDKFVRLWHVSDGRHLGTFEGHAGTINSLHFSSDALRVISSSQDSTAKLWDVRSLMLQSEADVAHGNGEQQFNEILTLNRHAGEVTAARFSPSGDSVLTVGSDRVAVIWPGDHVPPSIAFSTSGINYPKGAGPVSIDEGLLLSEPTRQTWNQWRIRIWTDSRNDLKESIGLRGTIDETKCQLKYAQPNELEVQFLPAATSEDVRHLLRRMTYECEFEPNIANRNQNLHIQLLGSGNHHAETITESKSIHLDQTEVDLAVHNRVGFSQ